MEKLSNKISLIEKCLEHICIYASYTGVSYFHHDAIRHRMIYNKTLINVVLCLILIRDSVSLFVRDPSVSLMLGDFAFNWKFKAIWNLMIIISTVSCLSNRFLHYWYFKHAHFPMKFNDLNNLEIDANIFLLIKVLKLFFFKIVIFVAFLLSFVSYTISAQIFDLLVFGLIASLVYSIFIVYIVTNLVENLFYFCLLAYKFKLQLQLENIRLKQLSTKHLPKALIERQLIRIITRIFRTYKQISVENKFWSKYLLIQMIFTSGLFSTFINYLVFGESNLFIFILLCSQIIIFLTLMFLLNFCCVMLHNEANTTLKMIQFLIFKYPSKNTSKIHLSYKVSRTLIFWFKRS